MHATTIVLWCGWGYLGCGALPTWRQGRRRASGTVMAVLLSFVILFAAALLLQVLSMPLTKVTWWFATAGLSAGLCLVPRTKLLEPPGIVRSSTDSRWTLNLLALTVTVAGAVIFYRALVQPLTGFDTGFRWDFLARQIVTARGPGFYPPVTDADFIRYMWPESIPPMISLLYAWAYLGAGTLAPAMTAPLVLLVAVLAFLLVWLLAAEVGGWISGWWACALLATSALHTWSISMGQETGLLTVSLLAMAWALRGGARASAPDWMLAGIAAEVAALSRDYGVCAIGIGAVCLRWAKRPWRELASYLGLVSLIAAPWYFRVWSLTGNPFYNHGIGDVFPVNAMHAGLMRFYADDLGFRGHWAERFSQIRALLWPVGPAVLLVGVTTLVRPRVWTPVLRIVAITWFALWVWSVSYTAGGVAYSLRVLSPVLAVLAIAGGLSLGQLKDSSRQLTVALLLVCFAVESSIRAVLTLVSPTVVPPKNWLTRSSVQSALRGDDRMDQLARVIGTDRVLVQSVYDHAFLANRGIAASPPWSPDLDFLTAHDVNMKVATARLRAIGFRYILISSSNDLSLYFGQYSFFRSLGPWSRPLLAHPLGTLLELTENPATP